MGSGLVALMAEQKSAGPGAFRRFRVGDLIGGYRVVEIAEHKVVIEFDGEKKTIDVYESAESVMPPGLTSGYPTTQAPVATTPQVHTAVPAASTPQPGQPPAALPSGQVFTTSDRWVTYTIEGNRRKYSRQTPFGPQVWYEDNPPAPRPP